MPTRQKWCLRHFFASTRKAIHEAYFCQGGIFAIQTCLIDQIVALMSIITVKIIYTNQFKLSSFYFIEFKEKSKKSKNRPKSTKSRKLKKAGPQPIKNHKITAKNFRAQSKQKYPRTQKDYPTQITTLKGRGKITKTWNIHIILYQHPILSVYKDDIEWVKD